MQNCKMNLTYFNSTTIFTNHQLSDKTIDKFAHETHTPTSLITRSAFSQNTLCYCKIIRCRHPQNSQNTRNLHICIFRRVCVFGCGVNAERKNRPINALRTRQRAAIQLTTLQVLYVTLNCADGGNGMFICDSAPDVRSVAVLCVFVARCAHETSGRVVVRPGAMRITVNPASSFRFVRWRHRSCGKFRYIFLLWSDYFGILYNV